jgi:aerobic-type carbon monoxide dehydrogenase small subunit (CoxS/CutS family)
VNVGVNGVSVEVDDRHTKTPLLSVPRDLERLHGVKLGCGGRSLRPAHVRFDGRNTKARQTAPISQCLPASQ